MSDYKAKDAAFTSTADSIRSKTGSSSLIQWDENTGFKTAIDSIVTGGGSAISIVDTADSHGGTVRTITGVSLAGDTVTAAHLESGYTAHDAQGNAITGSLVPGEEADYPTFTGAYVGGSPPTFSSLTCDKTFAECVEWYSENYNAVLAMTSGVDTWYYGLNIYANDSSNPTTLYYYMGWDVAQLLITQSSNGNIAYEFSPFPYRDSTDMSASGATVTAPYGYYQDDTTYTIASGTEGTPTATKSSTSSTVNLYNPALQTSETISPHYWVNGEPYSSTQFDSSYNCTALIPVNPSTTYTVGLVGATPVVPWNEAAQGGWSFDSNGDYISGSGWSSNTFTTPSSAAYIRFNYYKGGGTVTLDKLNTYCMLVEGSTLPNEYVAYSGVSSHSITVTPSVTNAAGYISGGTHTGTAVTVSASELVSGNKEITANGTNIDVTNYATASVSVTPSLQAKTNISPTTSSQTISADNGYDGLSSVQINAMPTMTLPTSAASSATSGYTSKATISRSTSDQYINIPTGYNAAGAYYKVNAVANGSATGPSSLSGSSATVSTGTNTITLTKTGVTTTPTVSAGYVASATASTATVALTASVTTKAATTYHPSTSDQTISSGTYTTGTQTIKAVTVSGLAANTILSGTTVKIGDSTDDDCVTSVSGSVTFQTIYSGSSAPSSSTGVNGDVYIQT
jgi:hypothetical protein